jgi:hypothetical protein
MGAVPTHPVSSKTEDRAATVRGDLINIFIEDTPYQMNLIWEKLATRY